MQNKCDLGKKTFFIQDILTECRNECQTTTKCDQNLISTCHAPRKNIVKISNIGEGRQFYKNM